MKFYIAIFILVSAGVSAQVSTRTPLPFDSIKFPTIEKLSKIPPSDITKLDKTIAQMYKMPVVKPVNPSIYSSLKAPIKDVSLYKIPNLFEVTKPAEFASK